MSNSLTIHSSISIQNLATPNFHGKKDILSTCNQLELQRNKINQNKGLSRDDKDTKLMEIDKQLTDLQSEIEIGLKKSDKKRLEKEIEEKKENLEEIMSPEMVEMALKMEQLLQVATSADLSSENPEDVTEMIESIDDANMFTDETEKVLVGQTLTEQALDEIKGTSDSTDILNNGLIHDEIKKMKEDMGLDSEKEDNALNIYNQAKVKTKGYLIDTRI